MPMLHSEPLARVADDLRGGRSTLETYLETVASRTREIEPTIHSLVGEEHRWERLRSEAADLAEQFPKPVGRPPLYGVPVGVKDIFHADGLETRAGSALPPEELIGPEAEAVTALREAGALVLGKTVTTEFAYFDPGETRNPHNPKHTPGGSSSGSAAAVAAGLCPIALGTQTIGSVIRPASFCGVVGFKPSYGRVSTSGVIPFSPSVDHVGYFTQDIEGALLAAHILCNDWRPIPESIDQPTLGVPAGPYLRQASEIGLDMFELYIEQLEDAGYTIKKVDAFDNIEDVNERHERLISAEFAITHEEWYSDYRDRYADTTRELIEEGFEVTAADIAAGRYGQGRLRDTLEGKMDQHGIDVWIAPAAPGSAPEGIDTTGDPVMNLPWTHSGLPTVALPAGQTDEGLPIGVQCASRFGSDEDLLRWSHGMLNAF